MKYDLIKLSVDVHAKDCMVCTQIDNATPQPAQRMSYRVFLEFVARQQSKAPRVCVCYEAGPTGFHLARKLQDLGVECTVVRPCRLDDYGSRVKNDRSDALALAQRFDRYLQGNEKAIAVVRIPTREQELQRATSRQRGQFHKLRQSIAAMGRSLMLLSGRRLKGQWWKDCRWKELQAELEPELIALMTPLRQTALHLSQQLALADQSLEKQGAQRVRPKGAGAKTLELIDREVCDWTRFSNRKQLGSYAGLCGGVEASGGRHADLPITKAGNRRLRRHLVEMAWRMVFWQRQSPLIQRWAHILLDPKAHGRARKKAIVAVARRLFVDLWRWRTGRMNLKELGWIEIPAA